MTISLKYAMLHPSKMITSLVAALAAFSIMSMNAPAFSEYQTSSMSIFGQTLISPIPPPKPDQVLSAHQVSLQRRYDSPFVNGVFKDNILLNAAYLGGKVTPGNPINWSEVEKPFEYKFTLNSGKTFAFHDDVLPKYQNTLVKTTGAHFNWQEGFKSDGYLVGDGVCHLASLFYWTAKDAGLDAVAPTNHDFMPINQIPQKYGVAIYNIPGQKDANAQQNLYITNTHQKPVEYILSYSGSNLTVSVLELN